MFYFASDNNSGVHPRIMDAIGKANSGFTPSYGEDPWTARADATFQKHFGNDIISYFTFLGTGANVIGLRCILDSHEAVICAESAHIRTDECGATQAITGSMLYTIPSVNGKIKPEDCLPLLFLRESVHHSYPKILSITQSTELGVLYSIEELKNIGRFCKEHGLYLHMDGARLSNAAAALNVPLSAMTSEVGVDVLSFGGTKNGLMFGEGIVFFDTDLAKKFPYIRKQYMQLMSKMRFLSAQFIEYLEGDLWLQNASHANRMAKMLADGVKGLSNIEITRPTEVNAVFVRMPRKCMLELQKDFYFYIWDDNDAPNGKKDSPELRWMTSFNTTESDVDTFIKAVRKLCS